MGQLGFGTILGAIVLGTILTGVIGALVYAEIR
jgi:hypothetical protein